MVKDKLEALSKLALLPWLQIYHDNEENRRASSDSLMDVYMLEKCHHFTLIDALVTIQTINLSVPGSELKKDMNGRGRHLEQKIWFLTINQVQPALFL